MSVLCVRYTCHVFHVLYMFCWVFLWFTSTDAIQLEILFKTKEVLLFFYSGRSLAFALTRTKYPIYFIVFIFCILLARTVLLKTFHRQHTTNVYELTEYGKYISLKWYSNVMLCNYRFYAKKKTKKQHTFTYI